MQAHALQPAELGPQETELVQLVADQLRVLRLCRHIKDGPPSVRCNPFLIFSKEVDDLPLGTRRPRSLVGTIHFSAPPSRTVAKSTPALVATTSAPCQEEVVGAATCWWTTSSHLYNRAEPMVMALKCGPLE